MAITNTNATNKTQITVDFPDSGSGNVKATLQSKIAISGAAEIFQGADVQTGQIYQCTLNASGNVDVTAHPSGWFLPTPDATGTAAWVYRFTVTDSAGNTRFLARTTVSWSASPQSLAAILAAAASSETASSVASLIGNKQDKDLDAVDDNIGIFANGETVDSGFSIGDLGGTPTAANVTFTPAGNIEAEDVQAAIEELDTEKSGTAHNHSGTYEPAGTVATHNAATNVHGIADTSALLDSGDIGSTVQANDSDLTAIAALSPSNDDIMQRKAGAWVSRSMAQLKTDLAIVETIVIACSDESTALTTGTAKVTFRMPYAMTLTAVRLSVTTAPTGASLIVNIKETGTTIFSTKPSIAAGSKTSVGGTPAVISDSALADDAEMTIDIDQIGSSVAGAGLKVTLIGTR